MIYNTICLSRFFACTWLVPDVDRTTLAAYVDHGQFEICSVFCSTTDAEAGARECQVNGR